MGGKQSRLLSHKDAHNLVGLEEYRALHAELETATHKANIDHGAFHRILEIRFPGLPRFVSDRIFSVIAGAYPTPTSAGGGGGGASGMAAAALASLTGSVSAQQAVAHAAAPPGSSASSATGGGGGGHQQQRVTVTAAGLLTGLLSFHATDVPQKLKFAFNVYDYEQTERVPVDDLIAMLADFYGPSVERAQIHACVRGLAAGGGEITMQSFANITDSSNLALQWLTRLISALFHPPSRIFEALDNTYSPEKQVAYLATTLDLPDTCLTAIRRTFYRNADGLSVMSIDAIAKLAKEFLPRELIARVVQARAGPTAQQWALPNLVEFAAIFSRGAITDQAVYIMAIFDADDDGILNDHEASELHEMARTVSEQTRTHSLAQPTGDNTDDNGGGKKEQDADADGDGKGHGDGDDDVDAHSDGKDGGTTPASVQLAVSSMSLSDVATFLGETPTGSILLRQLRMVACCIFGGQPAVPADENEFIAELRLMHQQRTGTDGVGRTDALGADCEIGSEWYLLASPWFSRWSFYVGNRDSNGATGDSGSPQQRGAGASTAVAAAGGGGGSRKRMGFHNHSSGTAKAPGPINNGPIVMKGDGDFSPRLLANSIVNQHFHIEAPPVWHALYSWYGGGPAVRRMVIQNPATNHRELELYPISIRLQMCDGDGRVVVKDVRELISCAATVREVLEYLCNNRRIDPAKAHLWDLRDREPLVQEQLPLDAVVHDLHLHDSHSLLLEVMNRDSQWPREQYIARMKADAEAAEAQRKQMEEKRAAQDAAEVAARAAAANPGDGTSPPDAGWDEAGAQQEQGTPTKRRFGRRRRGAKEQSAETTAVATTAEGKDGRAVPGHLVAQPATASDDEGEEGKGGSEEEEDAEMIGSDEDEQQQQQQHEQGGDNEAENEDGKDAASANPATKTKTAAEKAADQSRAADAAMSVTQRPELPPNVHEGHVGLNNLGNTCYMNSTLQCVAHTPVFRDYFLTKAHKSDVNTDNPLGYGGRLAEVFSNFVFEKYLSQSKVLTPRLLKIEIARMNEEFSGHEQHDAQELLAFLLSGLSEDLNRVKDKPYVEQPDSDGRPDFELADIWWKNHMRRELSIIVALFTGQYKSLTTCGTCGYKSARFEPFVYLQLPLPEDPDRNVIIYVFPLSGGKLARTHMRRAAKAKAIRAARQRRAQEREEAKAKRDRAGTDGNGDENGDGDGDGDGPDDEQEDDEFDARWRDDEDYPLMRCSVRVKKSGSTVADLYRGLEDLFHLSSSGPSNDTDEEYDDGEGNHDDADGENMNDHAFPAAAPAEPAARTEFIVGELSQTRMLGILPPDRPLTQVQEGDLLFAYEVEIVPGAAVITDTDEGKVGSSGEEDGGGKHAKHDAVAEGKDSAMTDAVDADGDAAMKPAAEGDIDTAAPGAAATSTSAGNGVRAVHLHFVTRQLNRLDLGWRDPYGAHVFGYPWIARFPITQKKTVRNDSERPGARVSGCDLYVHAYRRVQQFLRTSPANAMQLWKERRRRLDRVGWHSVMPPDVDAEKGKASAHPLANLDSVQPVDSVHVFASEDMPTEFGFTLRLLSRMDTGCSRCHWMSGCQGCAIPCRDDVFVDFVDGEHVAIDWHFAIMQEALNTNWITRFGDDASVLRNARLDMRDIALSACLEKFTESEEMDDVYCSRCSEFRRARFQMNIWRLPPVLVVHLKRFEFSQFRRKKLSNCVRFPVSGLDLTPYVSAISESTVMQRQLSRGNSMGGALAAAQASVAGSGSSSAAEETADVPGDGPPLVASSSATPDSRLYDLYAITHHHGALGGGHYVASIRGQDGQWRLFNDHSVTTVEEDDLVTPSAYILFYLRRDLRGAAVSDVFPPLNKDNLEDDDLDDLIMQRDMGQCTVS